jgi:hypothetical protein
MVLNGRLNSLNIRSRSGRLKGVGVMNWKLMGLLAGIMEMIGSAAYAQTSSSAIAQVRVQLLPKISVSAVTQVVDLGSLRSGTMGANVVYHVDANRSEVTAFVEVSDLYRMQDPSVQVGPIPLNKAAGILVQQGSGASWHVANSRLSISAPGSVIDGHPTYKSDVGHLTSTRSIFSNNVIVHVTWEQNDPDRTPGEYRGVVRLTTTILPN